MNFEQIDLSKIPDLGMGWSTDADDHAPADLFDANTAKNPALHSFRRQATAHRTRSITRARRAKSEATLSQILPHDIADGESWHVVTAGDVDALSYLAHVLAMHNLDYLALSTWCMSLADVEQIGQWVTDGRISRIDAYLGEIFPKQYGPAWEALIPITKATGGRIAILRNHAKIFLCRSGARAWVIESSANINTNPRIEQSVITADVGLFEHHKTYFDSLRSFFRDFDDWRPSP